VDEQAVNWELSVVQVQDLYYNRPMGATVQVRLNKESEAALEQLVRANGWTPSQAVRDSLVKAAEQQRPKPRPKLIGVGMFDSGISDLSTNKKYMDGFGLTGPARRKLDAEMRRKKK
jgi:hypothetical protein